MKGTSLRTVHKKGCENAPRGKRRGKKQGERPEFCNFNVAPYDDNTAAMGSLLHTQLGIMIRTVIV